MHQRSVTECTTICFLQNGFSKDYLNIFCVGQRFSLLSSSSDIALGVVRLALWYKIVSDSFVGRLSGVAGGRLDSCSIYLLTDR